MPNHFPVPSACHIAALQHVVTVVPISDVFGRSEFAAVTLPLVRYYFNTGTDAQGNPVWDHSTFDQDVAEAYIRAVLDGMAAAIAAQLGGVPVADVMESFTVARKWELQTNRPGEDGTLPVFVLTDFMPYPPEVGDADSGTGLDAGESVASG